MVPFSDVHGGYLTYDSSQITTRYNLLSSRQYENFNIRFNNKKSCERYCKILSKLQNTPYEVNKEMLLFLREHREILEEKGVIMPSFLSNINLHVVNEKLRVSVSTAQRKDLVFSELATILDKQVQRARYEEFLLKLATALSSYKFWFPAFVDFRGRIYRTGYLNFHERDLARSLLLFSYWEYPALESEVKIPIELSDLRYRSLVCAAYAHYKTPTSVTESYEWLNQHGFTSSDPSAVSPGTIIDLASKSKNPFLFIAHVIRLKRLHIGGNEPMGSIPISMDASSSAYQILSYFLLNEDLAERTNLIGGDGEKIQDLYTSLIEPLSEYLKGKLSEPLREVVPKRITRKLIKKVYMPMVYGKSVLSAAQDIHSSMFDILKGRKEAYHVAEAFHKFWGDKYRHIQNLMNLINLGGWFAATLNFPVVYHTDYFHSIQDYMKTEPVNVWTFDRSKMKRKKVTMSMPTTKRDRNKTKKACFASFIHQKDASIALYIIQHFPPLNLYTVHDNFIVNPSQARNINHWYADAYLALGDPLSQVNHFLFHNIIAHSTVHTELSSQDRLTFLSSDTDIDTPHTRSHFCAQSLLPLLEQALNELKPVGLKKDIVAWEKKQDMLLDSYKQYIKSLGFQDGKSVDYEKKYRSFIEKLHHKDTSFALHP